MAGSKVFVKSQKETKTTGSKAYGFQQPKQTKTTGSKVPIKSPKGHQNDRFQTDVLPIFLSRRPGRSRAGSSVSGRLVAMIILTCPRASNPSIWFRSSISVLWISLSADVPSENLLPPEHFLHKFTSLLNCLKCMYAHKTFHNQNLGRPLRK